MAQPNTIRTARGTMLELPLPHTGGHDDAVSRSLTSAPTQERLEAIICTSIDFSQTALPIYQPYFAVILDNVFSAEECALIRAVPQGHWASLVQGDAFREVDRTLVLNRQIATSLYARIYPHLAGAGVTRLRKSTAHFSQSTKGNANALQSLDCEQDGPRKDWSEAIAGTSNLKANQGKHKATWEMYGVNERLSFLRYGPGMHHDRHCDQVFARPETAKEDKSFLTCQVYLNDAPKGESESDGGGTTRFWGPPGSEFEDCFVDVVPKTGRVLVFQQRMLWHTGQPVLAGLKYAMRTDLMYKRSFA